MAVTRRQAREWAVQMLTAADLNPPDDVRTFMDAFWAQQPTLDEEDGGNGGEVAPSRLKLFCEERVAGVLGDLAAIDAELTSLLDHWDLYRLGTVERMVLRMGLWELKATDIPPGVVINEAIDLVNWFSTPKSRTLVNAVLDKYAKGHPRTAAD